jgi:hypothetical protein
MKQATNLKGISLVIGLFSVTYENSSEDYNHIRNLQIVEFDGLPNAASLRRLGMISQVVQ